jgi:preprotein translocase subunit SecD
MKPILRLLVLCSSAVLLIAAEPNKPHLFQLRFVLEKPTADSERMTMIAQTSEGQSVPVVFNVTKGALLDERDIKSARFDSDPLTGKPRVNITFTDAARRAFAEITRTNVNKQFAILIDGRVVEAPIIRTEIKDGQAIIDGNFTQKEMEDLANRINKAVEKSHGKMVPWKHGLYDQRTVNAP